MVCITGQVGKHLLDLISGNRYYWDFNPVTKWNYQLQKLLRSEIMAKAFYIARSGRPGPVLVDITKMRNLMSLSSVKKKYKY
jgi:acetolactate synthase-1/2/3 large subunit